MHDPAPARRPDDPTHRRVSRICLPAMTLLVGLAACAPPDSPTEGLVAMDYPEARRSDHVDTYFGTEVADPYRWFEDLDSEETAAWVAAQNELSRPSLESIPGRQWIQDRLTAIWDHERYGQPRKEGGRYFYSKNDGLQNQSVLYVTESLDDDGRVLLDPNTFREDGTVSLAGMSISPDATYLAYARSDGGSDWDTWHLREVATGRDLDDVIGLTKFTGAAWTADEEGFFYSRYPEGPDGKGDDQQAVKIYYHRLGTPQAEDRLVYEIPEHPQRNPYAYVTDDGRLLILNIQEGYLTNAVHYQRLEGGGATGGEVVKLLDEWDALYSFVGNDGDVLYFETNLDAPRNRVIAIDLARPSVKREVIPEAEDTLRSVSMVGGRLIANYLKDARASVRVFGADGALVREIELPGLGSVGGFGGEWDDPETFYTFTSYTVPGSIYRYDVATGESALWRQPEIDADLDAFETEQVFYTSKDGTRVPMFLVHRKGIEKTGNHPTLLYGYGGFNSPQTPGFSLSRLVWLEMGGVLAVANLRGGGEYGKEWHLAGTKLQKQNVFDDFIAAAEWLIENGWTKTERLAIQGGSNGGLLVGAVINQRPELFGAALPAVGVMDMLRYHTASANARNWSTDYGLSENEDELRAQLVYSPVHNVRDGVCYPPTLVTTADHDDRVVPWHSFKFGAAMQHAQGCANPILVRVETRAGHGAGTPTWMQIEQLADQWAFLARHLGMQVGPGAGSFE
ncbi:MAG TPA: prolyl oligopeptidase family serine peptidase [Thermoanaerobaculia bacterium]|nr:prolyl oligopeptidase family serine peptidase [Thermoanaerobaculia bacterium]